MVWTRQEVGGPVTAIVRGVQRTGVLLLAVGALIASALAGAAGAAPGDPTVTQIANINPAGADSAPREFTNVNGTVYFAAEDGTNGRELWKSVSPYTTATMVANINPAGADTNPEHLTDVNGTLFFAADDGTNGIELWKSDGTPAGTTIVEDSVPGGGINPAGADSNPEHLTDVNGTLFFSADDGTAGEELWKSDGTTATMVDDINGSAPGDGSNPEFLTDLNGTLFFAANDGTNGEELWTSDGTTATMVEDINESAPGVGSSPRFLTNVNGTLFFSADDGTNGEELWKSVSPYTTATSVPDADGLETGGGSSFPSQLTAVGSTLFFAAETSADHEELWKSDGTNASMVPAAGIRPGPVGSSQVGELTDVNGTLFFRAYDGGPIGHQGELWKSVAPFTAVTELPDISGDTVSSNVADLTNVNGTLYLSATDGTNGRELWKSDGTALTPFPDADGINPAGSSNPQDLTNVDGTLFFSAIDGTTGEELWRTGTEAAPSDGGGGGGGGGEPSPQDGGGSGADPPPNEFSLLKEKPNQRNGTVKLTVELPGAGRLEVEQAGGDNRGPRAALAKPKNRIKPASLAVAAAGQETITIRPTKKATKYLNKKGKGKRIGKLSAEALITFTPTGGTPAAQTEGIKLTLK